MAVVAQGFMSEALLDMRSLLLNSATWFAWGGERIHFHANRTQIEDTELFINTELETPFAIVWIQDYQANYRAPHCFSHGYNVLFMMQDAASSRGVHDDSAIDYMNNIGRTVAEIAEQIGDPDEHLRLSRIVNIAEATRVQPLKAHAGYDYWTSTWAGIVTPHQ